VNASHNTALLVGVPVGYEDVALAVLDGDFERVDYSRRNWLAEFCRDLSDGLVVALLDDPHARTRWNIAPRASGPPEVFERLSRDEDAGVRAALLGNPAVSSACVDRVLDGHLSKKIRSDREDGVHDWVLQKVATHPGLDEDVLERLPAETVRKRCPGRLAAPGDLDGTADLVAALAAADWSLSLGDARSMARLTLLSPAS
jgi:hypothetical protein